MLLKGLSLLNFRNIKKNSVQFHPSINIFLGQNGQGKTNLLEAIYLSTKGSSFRSSKTEIMVHRGKTCAYVDSYFENNNLKSHVRVNLDQDKKKIVVNDKKSMSRTLKKNYFSVLFSPESLSAIKSGPDERRELLDDILLSLYPGEEKLLRDYKKALMTRNRILRDFKSEDSTREKTVSLLESLNPIFFQLATDLSHKRIEALNLLQERLKGIFSQLINCKNVDISVEYLISDENGVDWDHSRVYTTLLDRAKDLSAAELSSGMTLVGPHKHDVKFLVDGEDSRYYCSQGQQRALVIAIKMAQILLYEEKFNSYPILLLDDVLSELDLDKRTQLIKFLSTIEAQIFITTTDLAFRKEGLGLSSEFSEGDFFVFDIENGEILKSKT